MIKIEKISDNKTKGSYVKREKTRMMSEVKTTLLRIISYIFWSRICENV